MNDINELVDLPEARRPLRVSWLVGALTSPPVAALAAVILWFASHNYLVPLIAGAAVLGFGQLASRQYRDQAWAFIPRKRQDRRRPLPAPWELAAGLALAAVLAAVLLLVALRLDQPDVSGGVRAFTFGMSAMAGLLVLADFAFRLLRYRGQARRRLLYPLPAVVAVAGSLVVADRILFGASAPDSPATLLWGAATMLAAGAGVGVWKLVEARRTARPRDRAHGG